MSLDSTKLQLSKNEAEDSSVSDFFSLLKPRVMTLAIFTSICGLYLAPGELHPVLSVTAILCISLGAGASGAINMWCDRDIDGIMARTKFRAIPMGKIHPKDVLGFGIFLAFTSVIILGLAINYFAAFLLALSIAFYIFIYTLWLKRKTHHNIVIGGAAGAFPPIIGWACVTQDITIFPLVLFLIIFVWTPPHFWALALYKDMEYSKVNIPMLPVVFGKKNTKVQIFIYSIVLFLVSSSPFFLNLTGKIYLFTSFILNGFFVYYCLKLLLGDEKKNDSDASKVFKFSILYLYLIFTTFALDKFFSNQFYG